MTNDLDAQAGGVEYDSDTRRTALAERARNGGVDAETVDARVRVANATGRPSRHSGGWRKRVGRSRPSAQISKGAEFQR